MATIETKYYNPFGDKSRGHSHPKEDLGKFFHDVIMEMTCGEECSQESLLVDYRDARGRVSDEEALFVIKLRLAMYSLANINAWSNGMVPKVLIGPNEQGIYIRQ